MDDLKMSIGSTIKERRIELNVKQDDLAEQVGVTVQTMSKWERDLTEPKASQVSRLSKALKISEKEICQGETAGKVDVDPLKFIKNVSSLMDGVPHVEFLMNIYGYIDDKDGFLNDLHAVSSDKHRAIAEYYEESYKENIREQLKMIDESGIEFIDEEQKQKYIEKLKKEIDWQITDELIK